MSDSRDQSPFLEDRPTLWPNLAASERILPAEVEQHLLQAMECLLVDRQRAVALSEQAVTLARAHSESEEDAAESNILARTLYRAAGIVQQAHRPDRAYVLCLEVQPMLERRDDRWRATRILLLRGQCCIDVGEYERALALTDEAAERFRLMEDRTERARSLTHSALALRLAGDLDAAVARAEQAVNTLDPTRYPPLDISFRNNEAFLRLQRGRLCMKQGNRQAAQSEFARASSLLPDVRMIASGRTQPDGGKVIETIVQIAIAIGDPYTTAEAIWRLAGWAHRQGDGTERGLAWLRMAECQHRRGRRAAALMAVRHAVRHLSRQPHEPQLPAAHTLLAKLLEDAGELQAAYEACAKAVRIESEQQHRNITLRAKLLGLDLEAEKELRDTEKTLAYAQRLSNVGHLVASVNHELNQPMASIRMLAETAVEMLETGDTEEVPGIMRSMLKLIGRLTHLTSQFAAFPAQPAPAQALDLRQAVGEALVLLRSRLAQTPCETQLEFDEGTLVHAQEEQLVRVIANLVNNALDVLEPASERRIVFRCVQRNGQVVLSVADNGPGLKPAVLERLFRPFFSTKAAGRGLGLGLAMSRDVMREMGGELAARNAEEGGAVFDVTLAMAGMETSAATAH